MAPHSPPYTQAQALYACRCPCMKGRALYLSVRRWCQRQGRTRTAPRGQIDGDECAGLLKRPPWNSRPLPPLTHLTCSRWRRNTGSSTAETSGNTHSFRKKKQQNRDLGVCFSFSFPFYRFRLIETCCVAYGHPYHHHLFSVSLCFPCHLALFEFQYPVTRDPLDFSLFLSTALLFPRLRACVAVGFGSLSTFPSPSRISCIAAHWETNLHLCRALSSV